MAFDLGNESALEVVDENGDVFDDVLKRVVTSDVVRCAVLFRMGWQRYVTAPASAFHSKPSRVVAPKRTHVEGEE
jgi:hypothetical protein